MAEILYRRDELEHRTGRRLSDTIPNSLPMLEPLSLLRPRGKNCQRKFSDQIPTHSVTRSI